MDDNKVLFELKIFDDFDYNYDTTIIKYFITPLYKRIFLDAIDTENIFNIILKDSNLGLTNLVNISKDITNRTFLTTSRNYKMSRFEGNKNLKFRQLYTYIPMPKFIWICEISTIDLFKKKKIIGEIVIDATASKDDNLNAIILVRYQNKNWLSNIG